MAGAIVGLHVFGADTGPEPLANLDNNYSAIVAVTNSLNTYSNYYVDTGAVNAIVVTPAAGQTVSLNDGLVLDVSVGNTNTNATPTLNINSLGAKTIINSDGTALLVGALVASGRYRFIYDGTNFRVQNPSTPTIISPEYGFFKSATTSRQNSTTLTNDPDLQYVIPGAGTYAIEVFLIPWDTSGTSAFTFNLNFSGTFTSAASFGLMLLAPATGSGIAGVSSIVNNASFTLAPGTSQGGVLVLYKGMLTATATGTLAVAWAQAPAVAVNTNVGPGSYMRVRQL